MNTETITTEETTMSPKPSNHLTLLPERLPEVPAETLAHFRRGPQFYPGSAWALAFCPAQYNGYGPTKHDAFLIVTGSISPVHEVIEYRADPMTQQAIAAHHREKSLLAPTNKV